MEYDDFLVAIGPDLGVGHGVQVRSPAGEGKGVLRLPFPPEVLSFFASGTWLAWQAVYRRGERAPDAPFDGQLGPYLDMTPEALGDQLFRSLFSGEVESLFRESLGRAARASGRGLRLRIELDPRDPGLARLYGLPWELLYRADTRDFLGLSRETPLVRYLPVPRPPRPLRCSGIRVLVVASRPKGMKDLQIRKEQRDLEAAWGRLSGVQTVALPQADLESLRRELLRRDYHVLHFMGHGELSPDGEGVLFFQGKDGEARPVSGTALAAELKDFKSLRLVVLNACETGKEAGGRGNAFAGIATALVLGGLPAVVAMQAPIPDSCAIAFSRTFYQRLAAGDPVDTALTEGRLAIYRLNEKAVDWATPSLFLRSPDGKLFQESASRRRGWLAALFALALLAWLGSRWLDREAPEAGHREAARKLYEEGLQVVESRGPDELAERAFQAALELDPDLAVARCGLASLERVRGREMTRVVDDCRLALQQSPDDPVLHYEIGILLADWGRLEEARDALEDAVRLDPGYTAAYTALGDVLLRLGDPAAARIVLEKELRSAGDPVPAPLLKNLARVDLREDRPDAAIARLRQALGQADARGRRELLFLLAEAQARSGRSGEACATLDLLVRGPESLGVGEWERRGRELARQLSCSMPATPAPRLPEVARSVPETRARGLLRAVIADFEGEVTVSSGPGGSEGLRRAHRSLVIPDGQVVKVAPGAWVEIVCLSDTRVYLEGRQEWTLDAEGCGQGEPLLENAYFSVAPEAGRVRFRGDERPPVLEQRPRGSDEENPAWPVLLQPRATAVLEARPEIVWSGVAKAFEYEIDLVGSEVEPARIEAGALSCGRSPQFPASATVCRAPYPESFPDLAPGQEELLRLWVRPTLAADRTGFTGGFAVRRLTEARAAEVRRALQEIDGSVRGEATRRLLRTGVFAREGLRGAAIVACQEALAEEDRPALRVTLGGLFLEVGLVRQAEASYEAALQAEPETAVRAAAELGLGRVAVARRKDEEARERFRKARDLFTAAGLADESAAAGKLLQQIGRDRVLPGRSR